MARPFWRRDVTRRASANLSPLCRLVSFAPGGPGNFLAHSLSLSFSFAIKCPFALSLSLSRPFKRDYFAARARYTCKFPSVGARKSWISIDHRLLSELITRRASFASNFDTKARARARREKREGKEGGCAAWKETISEDLWSLFRLVLPRLDGFTHYFRSCAYVESERARGREARQSGDLLPSYFVMDPRPPSLSSFLSFFSLFRSAVLLSIVFPLLLLLEHLPFLLLHLLSSEREALFYYCQPLARVSLSLFSVFLSITRFFPL